MRIREAESADCAAIARHDRWIAHPVLQAKIAAGGCVYVIEADGAFAGWMRWGLFWDNTPFLNMLHLLAPYRRRGLGSAAMDVWEARMASQGYRQLLTSTSSAEDGQHFYRKRGYRDIGSFRLGEEPDELLLVKTLGESPPPR